MIRVSVVFLMTALTAPPLFAQPNPADTPPVAQRISLGGPRVGITVLTGESARIAKDEHDVKRPLVTQFGWQFERRFISPSEGPVGVFEWVVLIGGLDQGAFFPSVSWITGIRTESGIEFGVGPNVTPLGFGFAAGTGINLRSGHMNFPLNLAIVSSGNGVRSSALVGFTMRR
jgi:hypothetical protein